MPPAQQRTRNRRRIDPGLYPLPVLYPPPRANSAPDSKLLLTWQNVIVMRGIPPVLDQGENLPTAAEQVDDFSVLLTYEEGVPPGTTFRLPDWCPELRGPNGEWAAGGPVTVDGGEPGVLPETRVVEDVSLGAGGTLVWTFDGPYIPSSAAALFNESAPGVSFVQTGANVVTVTYAVPAVAGNHYSIGSGNQGGTMWNDNLWSPDSGVWLAAGGGTVP